jgi:formylmethanofuran dehydrogenase subunit B
MICPFCSLLCDADDLNQVNCRRRESSLVEVTKMRSLHGSPSRDSESIPNAINALRSATRILVTGRIASVQTARAAVAFAAKYNATIDCAEGGHAFKNILAIQRSGMNSVSLAEARDHSDVFIVVGDDQLLANVPRIPSALANEKDGKRTVLLLGDFSEASMSIWREADFDVWCVPCELNSVPTAVAQWSRWSDSNRDSMGVAGPLFEQLAKARYTTVLWSAENLQIENADLWVERMLQWIATRNEVTRCAALAWSSLDGTFQQVCTWLTGFPGRVAFQAGTPEYDPCRFSYQEWLAKKPTNEKIKSVLVIIDETASATPFLEASELPADTRVIAVTSNAKTFPTAIAGVEIAADIFRADQTLLARVEPSVETRSDAKSAAHWLEALSRW